jgi:hypothetical protein
LKKVLNSKDNSSGVKLNYLRWTNILTGINIL